MFQKQSEVKILEKYFCAQNWVSLNVFCCVLNYCHMLSIKIIIMYISYMANVHNVKFIIECTFLLYLLNLTNN